MRDVFSKINDIVPWMYVLKRIKKKQKQYIIGSSEWNFKTVKRTAI